MQFGGEKFTEGTEDLALTLQIGLSLSRLLVVTLSVRLQQRLQRVGGCPHLSVEILQMIFVKNSQSTVSQSVSQYLHPHQSLK